MIHFFDSIHSLLIGGPLSRQGASLNENIISGPLLQITPDAPCGSFIPELTKPPQSSKPLKGPREDDKPRLMGRSPSVSSYMSNGTPDTQPHYSPPVGDEYSDGRLVFKEPPRTTPTLLQFTAAPPSTL